MDTSTEILDRNGALAFLLRRINYERTGAVPYDSRRFKLDRMRELLARLGDPQDVLKIIHIAGTKGKGSTAAMIGQVLTSAGYRTGLYTSPHLDRLEERFVVDHRSCCEAELADLLLQVRSVTDKMDREAAGGRFESGPTFFEIITAMALLHFVRHAVQAVVLEVGLGGRLDSTNVCRPEVSVITSISYDHTRQLGCDLASIAREKAGIIKPGSPVITGVTEEAARRVIRREARRAGCPLQSLGDDFHYTYQGPPPETLASPAADEHTAATGKMDYRETVGGAERRLDNLALGLLGRHQAANAAVALATLGRLETMGWRLPEEAIRRGLQEVRCPARVELIARRPFVVIDAAHNVASIAALLAVLDECFPTPRRVAIFAASKDKDVAGMLRRLLPQFDEVILTHYINNPRGMPLEELARAAGELAGSPPSAPAARITQCPDARLAWREARSRTGPDDLLCVTGSFFLAAEIRQLAMASRARSAAAAPG